MSWSLLPAYIKWKLLGYCESSPAISGENGDHSLLFPAAKLLSRWKISIWTYFNINVQQSHKNAMWQDLERVLCGKMSWGLELIVYSPNKNPLPGKYCRCALYSCLLGGALSSWQKSAPEERGEEMLVLSQTVWHNPVSRGSCFLRHFLLHIS